MAAIDDIPQLFLTYCKKATALDSLNPQVSFQDFKSKFTKRSESTSASSSGCHWGHYKALFAPLDRNLDEDAHCLLQDYEKQIANHYLMMLNYALSFGYALDRWKISEM